MLIGVGDFINSLSQLKMRLNHKAELQRALRALTDEDRVLTEEELLFLTGAAKKMAAHKVEPHNMAAVLASPIMSRREPPARIRPHAEVVGIELRKAS